MQSWHKSGSRGQCDSSAVVAPVAFGCSLYLFEFEKLEGSLGLPGWSVNDWALMTALLYEDSFLSA